MAKRLLIGNCRNDEPLLSVTPLVVKRRTLKQAAVKRTRKAMSMTSMPSIACSTGIVESTGLYQKPPLGVTLADHKLWLPQDAYWMRQALALAIQGADQGEVPVGAVLVHDQRMIGQGFNAPIGRHDATAHAEIVAIRQACTTLQNYRLPPHTTLYVTLEPCTMCFGALIHARVHRIIFSANEPRAGMLGSQMDLSHESFYNHRIECFAGLYERQSRHLLKQFFYQRRQTNKLNSKRA